MSILGRRLVVALGLIVALRPVLAQTTVLMELFTSEGCSSCPPADALLQRLSGQRVEGDRLVVALSEHVTYWNYLGWADPYSQERFTERQNAYGQRFHLDSVYTPQVVVNGEHEALGSDGSAVLRAIRSLSPATVALRIVSVVPAGKEWVVTVEAAGKFQGGTEVYGVVAEDRVSTEIRRGENGGRTLTHVAVARSLSRLGELKAGTMTVKLPASVALNGGGQHVVLFAQEAGQGRVLGVATAGL